MNFKEWILTEAKITDIPNHVMQSVQHLVGGEWTWGMGSPEPPKVPGFRYQWRIICEMIGRNVRMEGDKFYLKFYIQCYKKPEWSRGAMGYNANDIKRMQADGITVHQAKPEIEAPEGYFGGPNDWGSYNSAERYKKEMEFGGPFEKVTNYDPKKGHPLVRFMGFIEGWRPGMMPEKEIDWGLSAQMKYYPIPVSRPGEIRHDMERIGSFSEEPQEQGSWPDHRLNTPYEVAKFVEEAIDYFYRPRNDNDDNDEPEPKPMPSSPQLVKSYS